MTDVLQEQVISALRLVLRRYSLDWSALLAQAERVFLFGSRANGVERSDSDFDLLCVGTGRSVKRADLDLIWISMDTFHSKEWRGSELAGHVAQYGLCLYGEPDHILPVKRSLDAVQAKKVKIHWRLVALDKCSDLLARPYRDKHLQLIRRDLQRYSCLREGSAVPPTAYLDKEWSAVKEPHDQLLNLARVADVQLRPLVKLLEQLGPDESKSADER